MSTPNIIKSVRLDLDTYTDIENIAAYEERTVSNTIQRLLRRAVSEYINKHANSGYGDFIFSKEKKNN